MEAWEKCPIEECTPKQRIQRERMAREQAIIDELGIDSFTGAISVAVNVVADPSASVGRIVEAIWQLDNDRLHVVRAYSKWADAPRGAHDEKYRQSQAEKYFDLMTEPDPPKVVLRERQYQRLESMGYTSLDRCVEGIRPLRNQIQSDIVFAVCVSHHGVEAAKIMCRRD